MRSLLAAALALTPLAAAQPALFIHNATVCTDGSTILHDAQILIRNGRISSVGTDLQPPPRAQRLDAQGLFITPGLVDPWGAVALAAAPSTPDPTQHAFDNFDRYDAEAFRDAFAHGITCLYISAASAPGLAGTGTVVRLAPGTTGPTAGEPLKEHAALCIDLGSNQSPSARLRTLASVRKAFNDALDYRDSLDAYQRDLQHFLDATQKPNPQPDPGKDPNAPQPEQKPPQPAKDQPDDKQPPKPPTPPRTDPKAEVLLKAIDRLIPVRFRADRDADILNALQLAEDFGLIPIIEGAAEAHLVAHHLKGRTLILDRPARFSRSIPRRDPHAWSILADAGATPAVASGDHPPISLILAAQRAGADHPLALCTARAAQILGVDDSVGSIAPDRYADLVLWSDNPEHPGARPLRVYVAGVLMWHDREDPL